MFGRAKNAFMSERPSNLETARLTIELLKRIRRTRLQTAGDLHEQLAGAGIHRTLRSVQRHLDMLSQHFDIECDDRSKPYGYRWKQQSVGLSVPGMTPKEAMLLLLARDHLRNLLPQSVLKSMSSFFEQAQRSLSEGSAAELERQWRSKVRVVSASQALLPPPIRPGVLEEVTQALFANRYLEVDYENARRKRSKHVVLPLGLAQQGPSLYLVVKFRGFDDLRSLALHRMHSATSSSQTFDRPAFDLKAYDDEGRFGLSKGVSVRLGFRITRGAGLHLLETKLSADQEVDDEGDHLRVTATVVDSEWLWRWIRAFGQAISYVTVDSAAVDVLAPQKRHITHTISVVSQAPIQGAKSHETQPALPPEFPITH